MKNRCLHYLPNCYIFRSRRGKNLFYSNFRFLSKPIYRTWTYSGTISQSRSQEYKRISPVILLEDLELEEEWNFAECLAIKIGDHYITRHRSPGERVPMQPASRALSRPIRTVLHWEISDCGRALSSLYRRLERKFVGFLFCGLSEI